MKNGDNPHVGHTMMSETEFFYLFKILNDLMVLDTAGFGDNKAPELEIAQIIALISALNMAKSVKIVLVIEYYSILGERGKGLKEVLVIICRLFKDLDACFPSIMTLVTKADKEMTENGIAEELKELKVIY